MSKKTHIEEIEAELEELLDLYNRGDKLETLIYQRGLLSGWLARLAATDYIVHNEIKDRLEQAKRKTLP
jgi:hypothetical protein